jgi:hypothetical protein
MCTAEGGIRVNRTVANQTITTMNRLACAISGGEMIDAVLDYHEFSHGVLRNCNRTLREYDMRLCCKDRKVGSSLFS